MAYIDQLNSIHLDALKEVGNIGAGHAATSLSKLLHKKVNMQVPKVKIQNFNEIMDDLGGSELVVVTIYLQVEGDISGSIFFILPKEQAERYVKQITGKKNFTIEELSENELAVSFLNELGNIMSGAYLSSLADFTRLQISWSVPYLAVDMLAASLTYGLYEISHFSDFAIVIDTILTDESIHGTDVEEVKGHFFFLPDPDSFSNIFNALGMQLGENNA